MNLINSELKIKKLVLGDLYTNCYIISTVKKKSIIIDPGDCAEIIMEYVKKEKLHIKYIFNTHGHYDHIGANYVKGFLPGSPMLGIHREDLIYLSDDGLNLAGFLGEKYRTVFPDFYLADGATIDLDGINFIHIIHTPGHTPGSVCLRIGNYLFSGDLLFAGGVGRTDLPGGNEKMLFQSIKKIFRMKKNLVIFPGHGPETTIEDELKKNPFISFKDNIYEN